MRLAWLKVGGGFRRTNPCSNQELHTWSQPEVRTPVLGEVKRSRIRPSWVRKTLGFGLSCAPDENKNINVN